MLGWILILALAGLSLSGYIYSKKSRGERLVCLIGDDCNRVVQSRWSRLLAGIPNEVLGMAYYGAVLVWGTGVWLNFIPLGPPLFWLVLLAGGLAALISLVLIYIQAAVIREWCEYCLASAGLTLVIFVLEWFLA